jgi:hypothetical protein
VSTLNAVQCPLSALQFILIMSGQQNRTLSLFMFFASYWLRIEQCPVASGGRSSSGSYKRAANVALSAF